MLYVGKYNIKEKQRDKYPPTVERGGTDVVSE
jgi:hypothetical protein